MTTRRDILRLCLGLPAFAAMQSALARAVASPSAAWHVTGAPVPELRVFDTHVQQFMQGAGITAGQMAIYHNGAQVLNHGYTNAPNRPTVEPDSLFRIASCSKIFTCAAIETLRSAGKLDMNSKVFPLLGIEGPALSKQRPDRRINDITVQHLVDHAGGWNDHGACTAKNGQRIPGTNWDPVFSIRQMSAALGLSRPLSKRDMARYMYGEPLQFTPGTQDFGSTGGNSYSNFGYVLLGLVVEKISGKAYIDYVRSEPLAHDGTPDVFLGHTAVGGALPREVWYEDAGSGPSALLPRSNAVVPNPYGGEGYMTELMDSGGGLVTSAGELGRFITRHATWGLGGRSPGSERSGSMAGTSSYTFCRPNGVDCACIFNTRSFRGGSQGYDDLINNVRKLLDSQWFSRRSP